MLTVTDSQGRKYRSIGEFREPKVGEYLYCFDHKQVEYHGANLTNPGVAFWCATGHPEFLLHRIIVEPVPVTRSYIVEVRLAEEEFSHFRDAHTPEGLCVSDINTDMAIVNAIRESRYREEPGE